MGKVYFLMYYASCFQTFNVERRINKDDAVNIANTKSQLV